MPAVRRYEPYTSDVAATCLVPYGAQFYHAHCQKNGNGKHSIIRVEDSNGGLVWTEDLESQGIVHMFGLVGFRSNSDGTMKFFLTTWPPGQMGSARQRVLVETGVHLERPIDISGR